MDFNKIREFIKVKNKIFIMVFLTIINLQFDIRGSLICLGEDKQIEANNPKIYFRHFDYELIDDRYIIDIGGEYNNELYYLTQSSFGGNVPVSFTVYKYSPQRNESIEAALITKLFVNRLFVDKGGNLWVYSSINNFLYQYNQQGQWQKIEIKGLEDFKVNDIDENSWGVWIATNKGLVNYNKNEYMVYTSKDWVSLKTNFFVKTEKENIMEVEANDQYLVFKTADFEYFSKETGSGFVNITDKVDYSNNFNIFLDNSHNLWLFEYLLPTSFMDYNLKNGRVNTFNEKDGIATFSISSASEDSRGACYFVCETTPPYFPGIFRYGDGIWVKIKPLKNIDNFGVSKIFISKKDDIYLLFNNGFGLYRIKYN